MGVDHVVSSDTDSTLYHTMLNTDIGEIQIGDLYDRYTNESLELEQSNVSKDSVRKLTHQIKSASFDGENVVFNNISYIMKHHVKKRMFRIKCGDNYVDVTEDHSVIIIRDGVMQSIKPKDIVKSDKLIKIVKG